MDYEDIILIGRFLVIIFLPILFIFPLHIPMENKFSLYGLSIAFLFMLFVKD